MLYSAISKIIIMKINGKVTTGLQKAAFFLSQEVYVNGFIENCGFKPYPGTLNVIVDESYLDEITEIQDSCQNIIKPQGDFGAVKYIEAVLNDEIKGAIVFPAKTTHKKNYLEFIAEVKLRDKLNLHDGDEVFLNLL